MTGLVEVPEVGQVVVTPTGRRVLLALLAFERGGPGVSVMDVHPAARAGMYGAGLVRAVGPALDRLELTDRGRLVASWLEAR